MPAAPVLTRLPPVLVNPGNPAQGSDGNQSFYAPPAVAVAEDAKGDFVVVWTSMNDGVSILVQRFDPVGNPLGPVKDLIDFTTPAAIYPRPAVSMDAAGDFVVTWDDEGSVFASRFTAAGTSLDASPLMIENNGTSPVVALDDQGEFLVVYSQEVPGGNALVGRRGFFSGPNPVDPSAFTIAAPVSPSLSATFFDQAVATDAVGDIVVAFEKQTFSGSVTTSNSIVAQRVNAAGGLVGGLITTSTTSVATVPDVAVARNSGTFAVSWVEAAAVPQMEVQTFTVNGAAIAGPFVVSPTAAPPSSFGYDTPSVAADSLGNFAATWSVHNQTDAVPEFGTEVVPLNGPRDNNPTGNVFAQRFDVAGNLIDNVISITTQPNAGGPTDVAMDPAGEFVVVYSAARTLVQSPSGPQAADSNFDIIAVIFRAVPIVPPPPPPPPPPPIVPTVKAQPLDPALSLALTGSSGQEESEEEQLVLPILPPQATVLLQTPLAQVPAFLGRRNDPAAALIEQVGGSSATGAISGKLFADLNGTGVFEPGKPPLAGRLVFLDLNNNGVLDDGEPTAVTNANGEYYFSSLPLQTYQVRQVLLSSDVQTLPTENQSYEVRLDSIRHDVRGRDFGNLNTPTRTGPRRIPVPTAPAPGTGAPGSGGKYVPDDDDGADDTGDDADD